MSTTSAVCAPTASLPTQLGQETLRFRGELGKVLDRVVSQMVEHNYSVQNLFAVRLSVEEAIVNALQHGNRGNPTKCVHVGFTVSDERVLVQVEDEGSGFDPGKVADPLAPDNLERDHGRGLLLMRYYMTSVEFNSRGNCVSLCKYRDCV